MPSVLSLLLPFLLAGQAPKTAQEAEYLVETTVQLAISGGGGVRAAVPIPREWLEQRITASAPETVGCKAKVELVPPGAAMLTINTSALRPGEFASVVYRQRIFVKPQPSHNPEDYPSLPTVDAKSKAFLVPTPTIESNDAAIRAKAAELCKGIDAPWDKAKRLYDWTFQHIEYKLMDYTSAKAAFENRIGDCEERSSLFVALCRSQGIPARIVIGPGKTRKDSGHCWSEILLADRSGKAEWLPVDVGLRWFGEFPVCPMVLQKGESYPKIGAAGVKQRMLLGWARATQNSAGQLTFEYSQDVTPISANAILDPTVVRKPAPPARN